MTSAEITIPEIANLYETARGDVDDIVIVSRFLEIESAKTQPQSGELVQQLIDADREQVGLCPSRGMSWDPQIVAKRNGRNMIMFTTPNYPDIRVEISLVSFLCGINHAVQGDDRNIYMPLARTTNEKQPIMQTGLTKSVPSTDTTVPEVSVANSAVLIFQPDLYYQTLQLAVDNA